MGEQRSSNAWFGWGAGVIAALHGASVVADLRMGFAWWRVALDAALSLAWVFILVVVLRDARRKDEESDGGW